MNWKKPIDWSKVKFKVPDDPNHRWAFFYSHSLAPVHYQDCPFPECIVRKIMES